MKYIKICICDFLVRPTSLLIMNLKHVINIIFIIYKQLKLADILLFFDFECKLACTKIYK